MITGIMFLFIAATLWLVLGVVISHAAQKNLNLGFIQGAGMLVVMLLTLPIYFLTKMPVSLPVLIAVPIGGMANYTTFILMNKAMQHGPNGLIWAMVQSAFVLPFLMGICFFNVPCSATRICGIIMLLLSMFLMGFFGKGNEKKDGKRNYLWIFYTLISFLIAGVTQCAANIPSYLIKEDSSSLLTVLFRTGLIAGGIFAAFLIHGLIDRKNYNGRGCALSSVIMTLALMLSLVFTFFGLDSLAACNAGAIAYPMVVGISIVLFLIYTAIKLREKLSFPTLCGVLLCLGGIIVIAI